MSKYGKRPRMVCPACGKDVARNVMLECARLHKCSHGINCYGHATSSRPCKKCIAEVGCKDSIPSKTSVRLAQLRQKANQV